MTADTLKITVGQADDNREAARQRLERAAAGECGETIVAERPDSIRETTDAGDRDYKDVQRNPTEPDSLTVIEFTDGADGGKKLVLRGGAGGIDFAFSIDFQPSLDQSSATV